MFSSASSGHPFSYTDENPNYNSSQEEYPPPAPPLLLHFPSPFFDTASADPPPDHNISAITTGAASTSKSNRRPRKRNGNGSGGAAKSPNTNSNPNPNSKRRTGKKDRHSKICTAQGVRDRRMRLSVQIARKFFDLQDLLGFDKASKTIEWLFSKSKGAIKEVTRRSTSSSTLPRVVNSGRGVHTEDQERDAHREEDKGKGIIEVAAVEENKGSSRKKAASSYDAHHAKESRDKARERARARTRDKMMVRGLGDWKLEDDHEFPTENFRGTASASSCTRRSILGFRTNPAVSDGEDSGNKFMGVGGNWEMENSRLVSSDYGDLTNIVPAIVSELQEQNPNPISATSAYFQSQLMSGNQFYCRWQ